MIPHAKFSPLNYFGDKRMQGTMIQTETKTVFDQMREYAKELIDYAPTFRVKAIKDPKVAHDDPIMATVWLYEQLLAQNDVLTISRYFGNEPLAAYRAHSVCARNLRIKTIGVLEQMVAKGKGSDMAGADYGAARDYPIALVARKLKDTALPEFCEYYEHRVEKC